MDGIQIRTKQLFSIGLISGIIAILSLNLLLNEKTAGTTYVLGMLATCLFSLSAVESAIVTVSLISLESVQSLDRQDIDSFVKFWHLIHWSFFFGIVAFFAQLISAAMDVKSGIVLLFSSGILFASLFSLIVFVLFVRCYHRRICDRLDLMEA